jgi:P-type E1-E2 ATPase
MPVILLYYNSFLGVYYNKQMIAISIPGRASYEIAHIVCDVNGTLALDGNLLSGVANRIIQLRTHAQVHLITANTFAMQEKIDRILGFPSIRLQPGNETAQKAAFVESLNADTVIAIGQGANDAGMLAKAAIGLGILSKEGIARESLLAADLLLPDIMSAFDCLENPQRIIASLRK